MQALHYFLKNNWRFLSFGLLLTFLSSFGQSFFIALSAGMIRAEFALSHSAFGMIYSLATLASAVVLLWSGRQIDRFALRPVSFVVCIGFSLACFLMSWSNHFLILLLAIFLLRHFGQGLMGHTATTATIRAFEKERGRALSIVSFGFPLGEAFLPSLGVFLITTIGWRMSWRLAGLLVICLLPFLLFLAKQGGSSAPVDQSFKTTTTPKGADEQSVTGLNSWTRSEVLRDKRFYLIMPTLLSAPFLLTGFLIHQVHIAEKLEWPLTLLAVSFIIFASTQVLTAFITGLAFDRYGAYKLLRWVILPMGLALLVWIIPFPKYGVCLFMALAGVSYGMSATLSSVFLPEFYGTEHLGSLKAMVESSLICATAAAPLIFGWIFDAGVSLSFLGWVMLLLMALAQFAVMSAKRH